MYNNRRLAISIFWVILGITLFVLATVGTLDETLWAGIGGGLVFVGVLQIAKNIRYRTNADYRENVNIAVKDERNKSIRLTAWAYAGYSFVIAACVVCVTLIVAGYQNQAHILGYCVCFFLVVYWVSYLVLQKKR